jgi:membrane-bound metal-dependent hydrolase YbcI (DUF457 family)
MPGYRTHLVGGAAVATLIMIILCCAGIVALMHDWHQMTGWLLAALAGSLFPDIDIKSKGQNYFYWTLFMLFAYWYVQGNVQLCATGALIAIVPLLTKHRGILHNIWFLISLAIASMICVQAYGPIYAMYSRPLISFFLLGALSHVWLDVGLRRMIRLPLR